MRKIVDITLGLIQIALLLMMFIFLVYNTLSFITTHDSFVMFVILFMSLFVITKLLINIIKDFVTDNTDN